MTIHIGSKALSAAVAILALALVATAAGLVPGYQLVWLGLIAVCPLMMFFMMRGMRGSQNGHERSSSAPSPASLPGVKQTNTPKGYPE